MAPVTAQVMMTLRFGFAMAAGVLLVMGCGEGRWMMIMPGLRVNDVVVIGTCRKTL